MCCGRRVDAPPLRLSLHNEIPLGMGCGSSAAALLAGSGAGGPFWRPGHERRGDCRRGEPARRASGQCGGVLVRRLYGFGADGCGCGVCDVCRRPGWEMMLALPAASLATKEARALLPESVLAGGCGVQCAAGGAAGGGVCAGPAGPAADRDAGPDAPAVPEAALPAACGVAAVGGRAGDCGGDAERGGAVGAAVSGRGRDAAGRRRRGCARWWRRKWSWFRCGLRAGRLGQCCRRAGWGMKRGATTLRARGIWAPGQLLLDSGFPAGKTEKKDKRYRVAAQSLGGGGSCRSLSTPPSARFACSGSGRDDTWSNGRGARSGG